MAATAYNVLEQQYELYSSPSSSHSNTPSSSRITLDSSSTDHHDSQQRINVTQSQKAIASLTGAIVTSVFMTPFDVIKTRLQVQGAFIPPPLSFDAHHHTHLLRPSTVSASASATSASLPTPPRYQHLTGLLDGVSKVWRAEGATGLWRGLSPTLVMTVPSQVTYMTCYDYLRTFFLSLESDQPRRRLPSTNLAKGGSIPGTSAVTLHSLSASLAAGALARSVSATLVTPLELVRTRTQASASLQSSSGGGPPSLSSIIRTLARETSLEGPTVLWRGLGSTLWRDVPFSAIYFAGYEGLKRSLTGGGLGEGDASTHSGAEFAISFVSGSVSGSVAALFTQPADVIKTRLQTEDRVSSSSSGMRTRSTMIVAREIWAKEGASGLFKGLSPRIAKVAPACGVMIASFEVVGRALASRE
ncbi:hypothetical protein CF319_g8301 [Tilletia indica]|nr:hypothetical protein CF319_g8301 [Tilletia indica]